VWNRIEPVIVFSDAHASNAAALAVVIARLATQKAVQEIEDWSKLVDLPSGRESPEEKRPKYPLNAASSIVEHVKEDELKTWEYGEYLAKLTSWPHNITRDMMKGGSRPREQGALSRPDCEANHDDDCASAGPPPRGAELLQAAGRQGRRQGR
jgi:hypothetical protein